MPVSGGGVCWRKLWPTAHGDPAIDCVKSLTLLERGPDNGAMSATTYVSAPGAHWTVNVANVSVIQPLDVTTVPRSSRGTGGMPRLPIGHLPNVRLVPVAVHDVRSCAGDQHGFKARSNT